MLTKEISDKVEEHSRFDSLIDQLTQRAKYPTQEMVTDINKVLITIRKKYPGYVWMAYYRQYEAIMSELYKKEDG